MANGERHFLQWHITHECNLRCAHCYQEDYAEGSSKEKLFSFLDEYEEFVNKRGLEPQINLTGGEPLLHPAFYELAKSIRKRGIRLGVLTNGTLIDGRCAEKLKELKPVFVQISLDGTQSIHDSIRGVGSYEKALRGIDELKKQGVKVLVSFTAQKGNYSCFSELAKVCRKHGADKLWWDRVVSEDTEALSLSTNEFVSLCAQADKVRRKYEFLRSKTKIDNGRALQFIGTANHCRYTCSAGKNLLIFLADGVVMPCRRLPFVIGNLNENSLENIVGESEIMKELADSPVPEECMRCPYAAACRGGAKCVTYAQTGELHRADINCPYKQS